MRHLTTDSSLLRTLRGKPDNRLQHVSSLYLQNDKHTTPEAEWDHHWCLSFCTSGSLSELDSVSLAPAAALLSAACGESECGTATMVPSSLTWDFSVILSIPEEHKSHLLLKCVFCAKNTLCLAKCRFKHSMCWSEERPGLHIRTGWLVSWSERQSKTLIWLQKVCSNFPA